MVAFLNFAGSVRSEVEPLVTPIFTPGLSISSTLPIGEFAGTKKPSSIASTGWLKLTSLARAGVALVTVKSTWPSWIAVTMPATRWNLT
ncbi:hypothetical protein ACVW04_005302 [Bradyrhizobium sp. LM2.3]